MTGNKTVIANFISLVQVRIFHWRLFSNHYIGIVSEEYLHSGQQSLLRRDLSPEISFATPSLVFFSGFHVTSSFSKKKKINPREVLVLSDVRPSKNVTFCNVWARKGSSLCNRVRLNFQVCTLRDIEMSDWNLSSGVKDELLFKFLLTKQFLI